MIIRNLRSKPLLVGIITLILFAAITASTFAARDERSWHNTRYTPVQTPADYDGDGRGDIAAIYNNTWNIAYSAYWSLDSVPSRYPDAARTTTSLTGSVPIPGNFVLDTNPTTGKQMTDLAAFDPATGRINVKQSKGTSSFGGSFSVTWGQAGDHVFSGDFNGNGRDDFAYFRPSTGQWGILYINSVSPLSTTAYYTNGLGGASATPFVGDFNGDGKTDIAVRDANKNWKVRRANGSGFYAAQTWATNWGLSEWSLVGQQVFVGDFNKDNKDDVGYFFASTGEWHIRLSTGTSFGTQWPIAYLNNGGAPILDSTGTIFLYVDWPVVGDWNGDGYNDINAFSDKGENPMSWINQSSWNGTENTYPKMGALSYFGDKTGDGYDSTFLYYTFWPNKY